MLNPLDALLSKESEGLDNHNDDDNDEGYNIPDAGPEILRQIAAAQALRQPDNRSGDNRPAKRVQSAEDYHREGLQAGLHEAGGNAADAGYQNAADGSNDAGKHPRRGKYPGHRYAAGLHRHLVVGGGAHGDAHFMITEEKSKQDKNHQADGNYPEVFLGNDRRPDVDDFPGKNMFLAETGGAGWPDQCYQTLHKISK